MDYFTFQGEMIYTHTKKQNVFTNQDLVTETWFNFPSKKIFLLFKLTPTPTKIFEIFQQHWKSKLK